MDVNILTPKQKHIFDFITFFLEKKSYAPTLKEIAKHFHLNSVSTVHQYVEALQKKGFLNKTGHKQRAIKPNNEVEVPVLGYISAGEPMELIPTYKSIKVPEALLSKFSQDLFIQGIVIDVIKNAPPATKTTSQNKKKFEQIVNTIIKGDCLEVMEDFPNKSIDMILCDLPYGTTQNQWDSVIPLDQLWKHYERIIKDAGVIALTAQGLFSAKLMLSNPKLFKYKITWVKSKPTNFLNAKKQPLRKHEDILIFYKKQPRYNPQMSKGEPYNKGFRKDQLTGSYGDFRTVEVKSDGERYPTDVVYFKTAESEGTVYHPTQKPVALGRYLIRTFTKPGDIVLDNTCGSGTFPVAAVLEGRRFVGIEKNQEVYMFKSKEVDYIEICKQRIEKAKEKYRAEEHTLKSFTI